MSGKTQLPAALWLICLVAAALLEAGGDALVRVGLRQGRVLALVAGACVLATYGIAVNLPRWNFGRLMGIYIAVFFVVSQLIATVAFRERLKLPTVVAGVLIVSGGLILTLWRGR